MLMLRYPLAFMLATSLATATSFAASDPPALPQITVTGCAVDAAHTHALAETMAAAREVYVELGFNMPETVSLSIKCKDGISTSLFNDGNDQLFLSIPSVTALAPPSKSGVFSIYGMCHEMGHLAMYRTLKDRRWLVDDAAEGWAHYIGSVVVDRVFAAKGESLWPEPYDYLQDGTARLQKGIASKSPTALDLAAAQWQKLGGIVGLRGFAPLFVAWQSGGIDPVVPSKTLLPVLHRLQPHDEAALNEWWQGAAPLLVEKLRVSEFKAEQTSSASLSGQTVRLPSNGGTETSHMSIGGGGEGRKFTAPGARDSYLTAVWVYGSRYGAENPPDTKFDIALSDGDGGLISIWKGAYGSFHRGADTWTRFDVPVTRVPPDFYVTLNFNGDGSNGVYVAYDSATKVSSIDSLPGKPLREYQKGDWMIGVEMGFLPVLAAVPLDQVAPQK